MSRPDRLAAMSQPSLRGFSLASLVLVAGIFASACTGGAPATGAAGSGNAGSGLATGNPGSGVAGSTPGASATHVPVDPVPMPPGGPGSPGGVPMPSPSFVQPTPGLLSIHDVRAAGLSAVANAGHIQATVSWWSGPPPCSALAEVHVERSGNAFTLTIREGAVQLGIACPAMAMAKATVVDLGAVPAGTYTVGATGVHAPVQVVVG